jgi:hypothetical protein
MQRRAGHRSPYGHDEGAVKLLYNDAESYSPIGGPPVPYSLRLIDDTLAPARATLTRARLGRGRALPRRAERCASTTGAPRRPSEAGRAQVGARPGAIAGPEGARLLRFELVRQPPPRAGGRVLLEHPMALDPLASWLPPLRSRGLRARSGGAAARSTAAGAYRCLLRGRLDVTVERERRGPCVVGCVGFESGRSPSPRPWRPGTRYTSFIRGAVLPAEIPGAELHRPT